MILENKLNISDQVELAKTEEKISKKRARQLFDAGDIAQVEVGTFSGLSHIHLKKEIKRVVDWNLVDKDDVSYYYEGYTQYRTEDM